MNITVLGAGTWGTTLAEVLLYNKHDVTLWHYRNDFVKKLKLSRIHPNLNNHKISDSLKISNKLENLTSGEIIVTAIPTQKLRSVLKNISINKNTLIVNASKGIETESLKRMSEVIYETTSVSKANIIALHGPSHAEEVIAKTPTTIVAACEDVNNAKMIQNIFSNEYFRIYSNKDIIGVELGGAIKNVIAIASGICTGLGYADNTISALLTRGLQEIMCLGESLGAKKETFSGLSGIGDLIVTATSKFSRNRYVGEEIAKGIELSVIKDKLSMVAEGIDTSKSIFKLKNKHNVNMPISDQVYKILFNKKNPNDAILELMTRPLVDENRL